LFAWNIYYLAQLASQVTKYKKHQLGMNQILVFVSRAHTRLKAAIARNVQSTALLVQISLEFVQLASQTTH